AELGEKAVLDAIAFGQDNINQTLDMINELVAKAGVPKVVGDLYLPPADITELVKNAAEAKMIEARKIKGKQDRNAAVDKLRDEVLSTHFAVKTTGTYEEYAASAKRKFFGKDAFKRLEEKITRRLIAESGIRADGRSAKQIRSITAEVGIFARTH